MTGGLAVRLPSQHTYRIHAQKCHERIKCRQYHDQFEQSYCSEAACPGMAAVSAIETGRLTPSVPSALSLARALGCTVEELFQPAHSLIEPGVAWAWPAPTVPCRYWEAEVSGRRLMFPVEESSLNTAPHDGIWEIGVCRTGVPGEAQATLVLATCDSAVGLLAREYERQSGFRMLVFPRGGGAALDLAATRLIHGAAIHRSTDKKPNLNAESTRAALGGNGRLLHRMFRREESV